MNDSQDNNTPSGGFDAVQIGEKMFKWRDYTPIPILLLMLVVADPNKVSTTIGTVVIMFGEVFRLYSVAFIGSISRTRKENLGAKLVTTGPFRFVRNPLYVGNFLITIGFATYAAQPWFIFAAAAMFSFQYYCIVKYEETLLLARFGEEYERYCQEVPAWIPRRLPSLDHIEWPPNLSDAVRSEYRTFMAIIAVFIALFISSAGK